MHLNTRKTFDASSAKETLVRVSQQKALHTLVAHDVTAARSVTTVDSWIVIVRVARNGKTSDHCHGLVLAVIVSERADLAHQIVRRLVFNALSDSQLSLAVFVVGLFHQRRYPSAVNALCLPLFIFFNNHPRLFGGLFLLTWRVNG